MKRRVVDLNRITITVRKAPNAFGWCKTPTAGAACVRPSASLALRSDRLGLKDQVGLDREVSAGVEFTTQPIDRSQEHGQPRGVERDRP